ncbi:MAG TPA: hypothetical protein VFV20_01105 [Candidatus Limnocylindria bacterium]|nr:hypothetical protein [Candidatus Limnocylindria bacterium]
MNILRFLREQAKNYDCNVCGTNHSRSEISVLGKREGGWVVRVTCSKCETVVTLLVFVGDKAQETTATSAAKKTAPTAAPRRPRRPPVTLDEVLDAHELLDSYTGDAQGLFAPRGKVRTSTDAS